MINTTKLLGVTITNESEDKILEHVLKLVKIGKKFTIVTPNPEILVYADKHEKYKNILNNAQIALPDGVGVVLAGKLVGKPFKSRVTGVDFIQNLCKITGENPISMGFLGGRGKVAERAVECLRKKYPWIKVAFVGQEWSEAGFDLPSTISAHPRPSRSSHSFPTIDILFVAYGFPKQEEWIAEHLENLPVTAAMGVGGSFDYLSGEVVRAPGFVRAWGFEWLFRLIRQPWRLKRQLALLEFIWLVIKERLTLKG